MENILKTASAKSSNAFMKNIMLFSYYSETKRLKKGTLSHFLCGIKHGSIFRSFCRVKSGFSDKELGDLRKKLQPYFKEKFLSNVKYGKDKPDLKIDPKNSVVLLTH